MLVCGTLLPELLCPFPGSSVMSPPNGPLPLPFRTTASLRGMRAIVMTICHLFVRKLRTKRSMRELLSTICTFTIAATASQPNRSATTIIFPRVKTLTGRDAPGTANVTGPSWS